MSIELKGVGIPKVFLLNGYRREGEGDLASIAYEDLEGLYRAIARAVALSTHDLTPGEVRFLRKRLGKSQEEFGKIVGKTNQTVAKWEKGEASVPAGDGKLLRLAWLAMFDPSQLLGATRRLIECESCVRESLYVFEFSGKEWRQTEAENDPVWTQAADVAIARVRLSSKQYILEPIRATSTPEWSARSA